MFPRLSFLLSTVSILFLCHFSLAYFVTLLREYEQGKIRVWRDAQTGVAFQKRLVMGSGEVVWIYGENGVRKNDRERLRGRPRRGKER